ncbi:MAG: hypothetical protein ABI567_11330 [Gammaproteobacteria bacterium]
MTSSNGFLPTLAIDRRHCWRLPALITGCTLLALTAILLGSHQQLVRLFGVLLVLGYGARELQRASPRSRRYINCIEVTGQGTFLLSAAGATTPVACARAESHWLLPGAAGISFRDAAGRRAGQVVLFRDRHGPDEWRRLLVRLRHPNPVEADAFT